MTDDERARALTDSQRAAEVIPYIRAALTRTDLIPYLLAVFGEIRREERRLVWEDHTLQGRLWSFFRLLLSQGGDIQLDYNAGKYCSYEEYAARLDAAARERVEQWCRQQASEEENT